MPTPTTGTFTAIGLSVTLTGDTNWSYFPGEDMLTRFRAGEILPEFASKAAPANYNVQFGAFATVDTSEITLNKGTVDEEVFSFNGLPTGFEVTGLTIRLVLDASVFGLVRPMKFWYNGAEVGDYLSFNLSTQTFVHTVTPTPSTIGTFFGTNYGFNADGSGAAGSSGFQVFAAWLQGTYELVSFSWYIKPTEQIINGETVTIIETGDIIEVLPGEEPPPGFALYGTSEAFPDGPVFVWWVVPDSTDSFWIFSPISPGEDWVELGGTPSCAACLTIALGELEILIANASGVYALVPRKRNDTLYVRDEASEQVGTVDVKIPNPRIMTGQLP